MHRNTIIKSQVTLGYLQMLSAASGASGGKRSADPPSHSLGRLAGSCELAQGPRREQARVQLVGAT